LAPRGYGVVSNGVLLLEAAYDTLGAEYRIKDAARSVSHLKDTHLAVSSIESASK
jgi:hypothetical protein